VTSFVARALQETRRQLNIAVSRALENGMMSQVIPLELLKITKMASGDDSLELTQSVSWAEFPRYATEIINILGGEIINKADTPVERVWDVCINGERFWLSFNDFGLGVSLDSQMRQSSKHITAIRDRLQEWINAEDDRPI
jgi:hypothetical protein